MYIRNESHELPRRRYEWPGGVELELGSRTLIMGILNATPDSFSDGGEHSAGEAALEHARLMAREGADLIDVGGESTRPGFTPVPFEEEIPGSFP